MFFKSKRYKYLKEKAMKEAMMEEIEDFDLPVMFYFVFHKAWNTRFWETKGYDGRTAIKSRREPSSSPFVHDEMWRNGKGGWKSNVIYMYTEYKMSDTIFQRWISPVLQFIGITIGWYCLFKWVHLFNGNVNKLNQEEELLYKQICQSFKVKFWPF